MKLPTLPANHDASHLSAAIRHCYNFSLAVDGGAHRGHWTRRLLKSFKEVWAFEPHHPHFIELPEGSKNFNKALGYTDGRMGMLPGPHNDGQWYLHGDGEIEIIALDELDLPDCGFLKLDVEGYEFFALQGAEQTIKKFRPVIMIEENGLCQRYGITHGDCDDLIKSWHYRMVERKNKDFIYKSR